MNDPEVDEEPEDDYCYYCDADGYEHGEYYRHQSVDDAKATESPVVKQICGNYVDAGGDPKHTCTCGFRRLEHPDELKKLLNTISEFGGNLTSYMIYQDPPKAMFRIGSRTPDHYVSSGMARQVTVTFSI